MDLKKIHNTLQKERQQLYAGNNKFLSKSFKIFLILWTISCIFLIISSITPESSSIQKELYFLWFMLGIISSIFLISWTYYKLRKLYIMQCQEIYKYLINYPHQDTWIEIIEKLSLLIMRTSNIIFLIKRLDLFFGAWTYGTLNLQIAFLLEQLLIARTNLSIRLAEQQQTLESAKSEVEKNIIWTTELNKVSELQWARLDKQIEQFEELQRVLMKV